MASHILSQPPCSVYLISQNLVAKGVMKEEADDEFAAIEFAQSLGIRVPAMRRVIENDGAVYFVMDRIHGKTLEELWNEISWIMTIQLALQLRQFVQAMRTKRSPTLGSLVTGKCKSIWVEDYYGLPDYTTINSLDSFIRFWLDYIPKRNRNRASQSQIRIQPPPPTPTSVVFTHQDLAPRNILVDGKGRLWLVDWQLSGWFPIYFEYVSMQNFAARLSWGFFARLRWYVFSWIAVGIHERARRALNHARSRFIRYPLGRKGSTI